MSKLAIVLGLTICVTATNAFGFLHHHQHPIKNLFQKMLPPHPPVPPHFPLLAAVFNHNAPEHPVTEALVAPVAPKPQPAPPPPPPQQIVIHMAPEAKALLPATPPVHNNPQVPNDSTAKSIKTTRDYIKSTIDDISLIEKKLQDIQISTAAIIYEIPEKTKNLHSKMSTKTSLIVQKATDDANALSSKNRNIYKCFIHINGLKEVETMANSIWNECIDSSLKNKKEYINSINEKSKKALVELSQILNKAQHCGDNIHDLTTITAARRCTSDAESHADSINMTIAQRLTSQIDSLKVWMRTFESSAFSYCDNELVSNIEEATNNAVQKIQDCSKRENGVNYDMDVRIGWD